MIHPRNNLEAQRMGELLRQVQDSLVALMGELAPAEYPGEDCTHLQFSNWRDASAEHLGTLEGLNMAIVRVGEFHNAILSPPKLVPSLPLF